MEIIGVGIVIVVAAGVLWLRFGQGEKKWDARVDRFEKGVERTADKAAQKVKDNLGGK